MSSYLPCGGALGCGTQKITFLQVFQLARLVWRVLLLHVSRALWYQSSLIPAVLPSLPAAVPPACSPSCSVNAVCTENNTCQCKPLYNGDGITCTGELPPHSRPEARFFPLAHAQECSYSPLWNVTCPTYKHPLCSKWNKFRIYRIQVLLNQKADFSRLYQAGAWAASALQ